MAQFGLDSSSVNNKKLIFNLIKTQKRLQRHADSHAHPSPEATEGFPQALRASLLPIQPLGPPRALYNTVVAHLN